MEELAFKDFSIFSCSGHFVYQSGTILATLVGSHLGNIPEKLESHWLKGLGEIAFKANYSCFSIFSSGSHFIHWSGTISAILVEGHLINIPIKFK